jgi:hypothetical protein
MKSSLTVGLLLICSLLACSHPNEKRNLFPLALKEYNTALLWKNFNVAFSYLDYEDARSEAARLRRRSEQLRVVEVEPLESNISADGESATALVRFSWYEEADLTVQKGSELQQWKRIDGEWRMSGRKLPKDESLAPSPFLPKKSKKEPSESDSDAAEDS